MEQHQIRLIEIPPHVDRITHPVVFTLWLLILWHPVNWSLDPLIIDQPLITEPNTTYSGTRLTLSSFFDIDTIQEISLKCVVHCTLYRLAECSTTFVFQHFSFVSTTTSFWGGLLVLVRRDSKSIGTGGLLARTNTLIAPVVKIFTS